MVNLIIALALSVFSDGFEDPPFMVTFYDGTIAKACQPTSWDYSGSDEPFSVIAICRRPPNLRCLFAGQSYVQGEFILYFEVECKPGSIREF